MVGDLYSKQLLRFVFTGSRGGETRARVIREIRKRPLNTNQLAHILELDYKSISHHLRVLEKNNTIKRVGGRYGGTYHISTFLEINFEIFEEMVETYARRYRDKQFVNIEKDVATLLVSQS